MRPMESLLRPFLKAPVTWLGVVADDDLPTASASVPAHLAGFLGVETGNQILIGDVAVLVLDGEAWGVSRDVADAIAGGLHPVRRRLVPLVVKEWWALSFTVGGSAIVLVTLTGGARVIATVITIGALVAHLMSLRIKHPRGTK